MLANQFIGYDDAGNSHTIPGGAWCLKLTDLRFSVDASGSVYEVQAISYNHQAFTDTLQQTRTNTGFSGFTVKTVLDELFVESRQLSSQVHQSLFSSNSVATSSNSTGETKQSNGTSWSESTVRGSRAEAMGDNLTLTRTHLMTKHSL